jgi:hypothetical protein
MIGLCVGNNSNIMGDYFPGEISLINRAICCGFRSVQYFCFGRICSWPGGADTQKGLTNQIRAGIE